MNRLRTILTLSLFAGCGFLGAQSPTFYHLNTAEGLSDNNVSTLVRDQNGILWIATTEGLNSFDGNRIRTYNKYNQPELPDNHIDRILVDGRNRVWLRTSSHYLVMLDAQRKFHRILVGDTTDRNIITSVLYTRSRGLIALKGKQHYILQETGPLRFEKLKIPFEDSLSGAAGFTYYPDNDWAIYYRGGHLVVVDYAQPRLLMRIRFPGISGAHYLNNDELITFSSAGDVFYRIRISTGKVVGEYRGIRDQQGLPLTGTLRNMTRIDSSRFAFTTFFAGIYIIDFAKGSAQHYVHDPIDPRSIGGNNTLTIRYDTSGYLFVTTQTSGLHFYNMKEQQAATKPYFMDEEKQVFDGYIQFITSDAGSNLWMGAQDRLIRWEKKADRTSFIPLRLPDGTNISGQETIRCVDPDEDGRTWVGTTRYGILVLDQQLRTIGQITDSLPGKRTGFPSRWVNAIYTDRKGNQWVSTVRGVCLVRKEDLGIRSLKGDPLLDTLSRIAGSSLWQDKKGRMWIGSTNGAWCYDEDKKTLVSYTQKTGLAHNTVYAFNEDDRGKIYVATLGGLSVIDADGRIRNFNRTNGLRNDRCEGILKDAKGFLWIGNMNCILRYDPVSSTFAVFEEGIGFSHAGFRMRTAHQTPDGEMFWGTDKGLIYFFPEQMSRSSLPLHPSIHALQAGNTEYRFTGSDETRFPYHNSSFAFTFSSGELSGDKKNQLRYRLRGFDPEWMSPVTVGQAVYSKLPPGQYHFEVRASRDGINWYDAPYAIRIVVTAPWWRQTWFRLLCAGLLAALAYVAYLYYRRRKKTREISSTIDYFAHSPYDHASTETILWDMARNCISRLGFEDCVIYLADEERQVLVQKAAYGPKSPKPYEIANPIEIPFGKGIVGDVAISGKTAVVNDTRKDSRYLVDDQPRLSELSIPIIHEHKVIGVIDTEHPQKNFFTREHVRAMQTIASLCSAKISRAMALEAMQKSREELMVLNVKMAETRFLNLRLQMNPHFLFNSLSSIQHLIVSQQTNKAYKYLTVFSHFLRSLLNFAEKNFIPLDEELKILQLYVELESLRFDESFTWEIVAEESLLQDEVLVPSLMVQPFAENAIWHGLLHKEGEKKLVIRFSNNSEEFLSCTIEDNGIGREKALSIRDRNIHSKMRESKGIGIIRERLALLQQKTGKPASIEIEDLVAPPGEVAGTRVRIIIPYYNPEES